MKKISQKILTGVLLAVVATAMAGCSTTSPSHPCTVTNKDHAIDKDGNPVYRIYSDCGVFNVEDAALVGQFNSADTYASIQVGHTYEFTTYGYRNGFFSMFPNITKAVEVAK